MNDIEQLKDFVLTCAHLQFSLPVENKVSMVQIEYPDLRPFVRDVTGDTGRNFVIDLNGTIPLTVWLPEEDPDRKKLLIEHPRSMSLQSPLLAIDRMLWPLCLSVPINDWQLKLELSINCFGQVGMAQAYGSSILANLLK